MKKLADWIVDKRAMIFIVVAVLTVVSVIGMFKTNVNYDMSKYLLSDSSVKHGMELMVVFILPAILLLLDRIIYHTGKDWGKCIREWDKAIIEQ